MSVDCHGLGDLVGSQITIPLHPGYRHQNTKGPIANGERAFCFISIEERQAAFETSVSLSTSSVPIRIVAAAAQASAARG